MSSTSKQAHKIVTYNTVFPQDLNHNQELFAGRYVEEMEKAAFFAATKFSNRNVVSASIEALDFKGRVPCGAMVRVESRVVFVSTHSMVVSSRLYAEDRFSGKETLGASGYFILVGLDTEGDVAALPELQIENEQQQHEWEAGKLVYERSKARRTSD